MTALVLGITLFGAQEALGIPRSVFTYIKSSSAVVQSIAEGGSVFYRLTDDGASHLLAQRKNALLGVGLSGPNELWISDHVTITMSGSETSFSDGTEYTRIMNHLVCETHCLPLMGDPILAPNRSTIVSATADEVGVLCLLLEASPGVYSVVRLLPSGWKTLPLPREFRYYAISAGRSEGDYFVIRRALGAKSTVEEVTEIKGSHTKTIAKMTCEEEHSPDVRFTARICNRLGVFAMGEALVWIVNSKQMLLKRVQGKWQNVELSK